MRESRIVYYPKRHKYLRRTYPSGSCWCSIAWQVVYGVSRFTASLQGVPNVSTPGLAIPNFPVRRTRWYRLSGKHPVQIHGAGVAEVLVQSLDSQGSILRAFSWQLLTPPLRHPEIMKTRSDRGMLEVTPEPRIGGRLSVVLRARSGSLTRTAPRTRDCRPRSSGSTQGRLFRLIAVLRGGASRSEISDPRWRNWHSP
jgi:hypothetical protein